MTPYPALNFIKIASGSIPFLGKFLPKINNLSDFGGLVSPHFKSDSGEIWREGTDLRHTPRLIL